MELLFASGSSFTKKRIFFKTRKRMAMSGSIRVNSLSKRKVNKIKRKDLKLTENLQTVTRSCSI
jgi:hypothetical protein